jgi:hypothetical protein
MKALNVYYGAVLRADGPNSEEQPGRKKLLKEIRRFVV